MKYLFFTFIFLILFTPVIAQVMSSTNYIMEIDSINIGGGFLSSDSYLLESAIGQEISGISTSTNFDINQGYLQMSSSFIGISVIEDQTLSPAINLAEGGVAENLTQVTVATNNSAGYQLKMKSDNSPALRFGLSEFDDYDSLDPLVPDYDWSVSGSQAKFGFTVSGVDTITEYKNNGSECNQALGSASGDNCWDGLSTVDKVVAESNSFTAGTQSDIKFKAEAGADSGLAVGAYQTTIFITAYTK